MDAKKGRLSAGVWISVGMALVLGGGILMPTSSLDRVVELLQVGRWDIWRYTEDLYMFLPLIVILCGAISIFWGARMFYREKYPSKPIEKKVALAKEKLGIDRALSVAEQKEKQIRKMCWVTWLCGLTGLAELLCVAWEAFLLVATIGAGVNFLGVIILLVAMALVAVPFGILVGTYTEIQIRRAKELEVEVSRGRSVVLTFGTIFCFAVGVIMVLVFVFWFLWNASKQI